MRDHLHHITLRHWDSSMRTLGAISLAKLLELEEAADLDDSTQREVGSMYDVADSRSRNSLRSMR